MYKSILSLVVVGTILAWYADIGKITIVDQAGLIRLEVSTNEPKDVIVLLTEDIKSDLFLRSDLMPDNVLKARKVSTREFLFKKVPPSGTWLLECNQHVKVYIRLK